MMATIWQFEAEPDEWVLTYRIRYNAGPNSDPWDMSEKGDRKSWYAIKLKGGEKARKDFMDFIEMLPLTASAALAIEPMAIDWLVVQGGVDKFFEVAKREKKSWMHMREEKLD